MHCCAETLQPINCQVDIMIFSKDQPFNVDRILRATLIDKKAVKYSATNKKGQTTETSYSTVSEYLQRQPYLQSVMARIENVSDTHDRDGSRENGVDAAIPVPALPPHLSEMKNQTVDEVAADLKRSPFFMTSLEDADDKDNPELDAIRALMYEGTRAEIAEGFREQGNEMAKAKKWSDGKEQYSKGILALRVDRKEGDPTGEEEDKREKMVLEACYVNRALCNLELRMLQYRRQSMYLIVGITSVIWMLTLFYRELPIL